MFKIIALNQAESNENEEEYVNILTKEAQEQVALNEYNRALELLITNKKQEALNVLNELLNTDLLDKVDKPEIKDGRSRPMVSLKYSCFKNIASIEAELQNYHNALYNYWEAANLDDTDVVLWFRIGLMAIKISNLDIACFAFKQGLKINCNHWPCLDNIITVLYAIPDYMNCLLYISLALEKDPTYIKGLAFRQQIFKNIPAFQECYKIYNNTWIQDPSLDTKYDQAAGFVLLNEAKELKRKWVKISKTGISKKSLIDLSLKKVISEYSWLELGRSVVDMYRYIIDNNLNFVSHIILSVLQASDSIFADDKNKTYYTKFHQNSTIPLQNICFTNNKKVDPNGSILKTNFDTSTKFDSHLIQLNEASNKNKSCTNEIFILEENSVLPLGTFHINELKMKNSNMLESNENNLIRIKNDKYSNKKKIEIVNNKVPEKISHIFDNKQFQNNEITLKLDEKEKSQKVKKRRRSSLCFLTQWAWSNNNIKRSTRARTSGRKDYERDGVLLEEILKRIFPSTLLPDNTRFTKKEILKNNDNSMDTSDLYNVIVNKDSTFTDDTKSTESSKSTTPDNEDPLKYFGTEQEIIDVKEFIKDHTGKSNIIIIIVKFLEILCRKWKYEWPNDLPDLYIHSYIYMRKHIPYSSPFVKNSEDCLLKLDAEATLLFCELYTDKWLSSKPYILSTSSLNRLGIGISSDDLSFVIFSSSEDEIYNEKNINFLFRSLWLKANIFLYQGDVEIAMKTLELLLDHMQQLQSDMCKSLKLINCKYNSIISIKNVQKMLTFIQRGKKFCEIKYLYREKKYEELSYILKDTFHFSKQLNQFILCNEVPIDRVEHLQILLDTLWQLQQHEDCYVWAEICLNESWYNYLHAINNCTIEDERNKWMQLVLYSLEKLEACVMEVSTFIVKYLPESRRSRLVQNLVHIVSHQLDVLDNMPAMQIESVSPWILLHFILQYEEDKERAKPISTLKYKSHTFLHSDEDDDEEFPASVTILLKAHEFLGRHGWCCINEGKLLLFILKLIVPKLHFPLYSSIKRKLKESIEQVIYCLYGHPSKFNTAARSKPKYIDEHVKTSINLSWETCQLLFEFYTPEILPNFESKRIDSINLDTVILFKKICSFIPIDSDPTKIAEEMNSYLIGNKEDIPRVKKSLPHQISYIYYLIADHYFKAASNQSWSSAVKYYTFDLCLHPNEFNSWAGLAMSTSTLMETWLNNFQPNINEEKYLSKAKIAQRSYQHAIQLVPSHLTIWTEFGNFLYTVHSFCSRLLKQESDSLNMKRFRILETRKEEMLDEAKNCFISANNIYVACQGIGEPQDERWLYQYMLAKIAEKKNQDPPIFLKYYSKASELLNYNKAQYPKRINHKNPQNLSIESLEVYYRIHASILKYLEQHEGEPLKKSLAIILENNLMNCMQSPFILYDSIFSDASKNHDKVISEMKMSMHKQLRNIKDTKVFTYNTDPTIMNKSTYITNKLETRKRYIDETIGLSGVKRIKVASISHLQLMQDVVALIDDLITKVCDKVSSKQIESKFQDSESKTLLNNDSVSSIFIIGGKNSTPQHFTDNLTQEKTESKERKKEFNDENNQKPDGNWFKKEEFQMDISHKSEKIDDKKKMVKIERTLSRRSSQESTSTTQTSTSETNNSTSSSSDDSTSTDDSTDSSTSTDSDSDSIESNTEKKKKDSLNEYTYLPKEDTTKLIEYCLSGLEQCVLRFPEHYKSIYRLAYFFFYNKVFRNIVKCKQLLLGTYKCQFYHNQIIQGLFAERKNANFFNGIWRIPINEIDRPGSFASHMSRCVVLLMQVLKETSDSRMLIELCVQLRKIPDTDKKYLRDSEREQLSCQALTLCLQCLRNRIKVMNVQNKSIEIYNTCIDEKMQILLDIYYAYQNIKNMPEYEIFELPKVRKLLEDAYILYIANSNIQGNIFELAKECCRQKLRAIKIGIACYDSNINTQTFGDTTIVPPENTNLSATLSIPFIAQTRKSQKVSVAGRPRGRPPGVQKFPQILNSNSLLIQNQYSSKHSSTSSTYVSNASTVSNDPRYLPPFLEPNMLAAMFAPNFNANIIDSAMNYFNQAGTYQDVFRQYQNSINTMSDLKINYKKNSNNMTAISAENNIRVTDSLLKSGKEKPNISITPVIRNKQQTKPKSTNLLTTNFTHNKHSSTSVQLPKTVGITSNSGLFKSTQSLSVSQTLSNQVSLKKNSLTLGNTNSNCVNFPQIGQTTFATVGLNESISRRGTSLQHKLLSKKQNQRANQTLGIYKQKQTKTILPSNYTNQLKSTSTSHSSKDSTLISVNALPPNTTKYIKLSSSTQKPINTNITEIPVSTSSLQDIDTAHTLSVLSQLQQHSHLEIIPKTNHVKLDNNLINIPGRSIGASNFVDSINLLNSENISIYELSRSKMSANYPVVSQICKNQKSEKDNVEIITLDD